MFDYSEAPPRADSLLWVARAFAGCSSARGSWQGRIAAVTTSEAIELP